MVNLVIISKSTFRKIKLMIQIRLAIKKYKVMRNASQLRLAVDHQKRKQWLIKRREVVDEKLRQ